MKIPIRMPGAGDAKGELKKIAQAERDVGQAAEESGRKAGHAGEETRKGLGAAGGAAEKLGGAIKSLIAGYVGIQGVTKVLSILREEHDKAAEAALRHATALRAVLSLSTLAGERPETIAAIQKMAVASGRPMEEVTDAYQKLLGGTAGMARGRQQGLMQQALLMGQANLKDPLSSMVSLMSTMGTQAPGLSPLQVGNLADLTLEQSKASAGELAGYLPGVLTAASAGGVGPDVAAAAFSFATRAGGEAAGSATAAKSTLMGLMAPSRETARLLGRMGMPEGDLMGKVDWLAASATRLPDEAAAALGGRRGIELVAAIAKKPAEFQAEIAMMQGELNRPGSRIQAKLEGMYGEVPAQRTAEQFRRITTAMDVETASPAAMKLDMRQQFRDLIRRKQGMGPLGRRIAAAPEWLGAVTGLGLPGAGDLISAMEALLEEGYAPEDIYAAFEAWGGRAVGADLAGPSGEAVMPEEAKASIRSVLSKGGARPLQGTGPTVIGGTVYINADKADPAGKPVAPAIQN